MHDLYLSNVPTELADVQPLGDFVLVRRLPDSERTPSGYIVLPDGTRNKREGKRRGVVILVGPGDKRTDITAKEGWKQCTHCAAVWNKEETECVCGQSGFKTYTYRHPMHVAPGDEIIYDRVPANDIRIDGEEYTFLHEEQHILCVLEREPCAA